MSWAALEAGSSGWRTWQAAGEELDIFFCRGEQSGRVALITAGVHGDEYEGPATLGSLAGVLSPGDLKGTVIALPVVNPAAFRAGTRLHPYDGSNLARKFPGNPTGGPSDQLAAAIFENFVAPADYVIDLHSGGVEYVFSPVAGFYGEPVTGNPSFEAALAFGLPALWKLPETAGVLSCEAWRGGKVAIGNEYLGAGRLSHDGVRDYRNGVLACLSHWGMMPSGSPPPAAPVFAGDWQLATSAGIFTACCSIGDSVRQGATLAAILGVRGQILQEFFSTCDGVVLGLRSKACIRETNWAVLVGRRIA